jgi:peroxiredoxin
MQDRTETLNVGSRAPEFSLAAANWEGKNVTLSAMLGRGPVIVEFLRGTW